MIYNKNRFGKDLSNCHGRRTVYRYLDRLYFHSNFQGERRNEQMIALITDASHTGKTMLSQKLLPYNG